MYNKTEMPLKKYIPPKPYWAPTQKLRATKLSPQSPPPVLVPFTPPSPPTPTGAFSNAFSNAFNI
jgi:hypothetical protein